MGDGMVINRRERARHNPPPHIAARSPALQTCGENRGSNPKQFLKNKWTGVNQLPPDVSQRTRQCFPAQVLFRKPFSGYSRFVVGKWKNIPIFFVFSQRNDLTGAARQSICPAVSCRQSRANTRNPLLWPAASIASRQATEPRRVSCLRSTCCVWNVPPN